MPFDKRTEKKKKSIFFFFFIKRIILLVFSNMDVGGFQQGPDLVGYF